MKPFPGLDIVRLSAAFLVALYHFGWALRPDHRIAAFSSGWVGVETFFVISGFVIAFSADGKSVGRFVRSRALRLYPAAFICSTIIIALQPAPLATYLRSIALYPAGPWVDIVYWTLPIEMAFYALIGVALWRRWSLAKVALGLGIYSGMFWSAKILLFAFGIKFELPGVLLGRFGAFFALGMLLYAKKHPFVAALLTALCLFEAASRSYSLDLGGAPFFVAPLIWFVTFIAILVCIRWNESAVRWLRSIPTRTMGLMTYPFYLVHSAIGLAIMRVLGFSWFTLVLGFAAALTLAFLILPIEKVVAAPFRKAQRRPDPSPPGI